MKLLKAIIRPNKIDDVKDALAKLSVSGMTVTEVRGHGKQKGHTAVYRGKEYNVSLLPKMQVEVVVTDTIVDGRDPRDRRGGAHRRNRRRPRLRAAGRTGLPDPHRGAGHLTAGTPERQKCRIDAADRQFASVARPARQHATREPLPLRDAGQIDKNVHPSRATGKPVDRDPRICSELRPFRPDPALRWTPRLPVPEGEVFR